MCVCDRLRPSDKEQVQTSVDAAGNRCEKIYDEYCEQSELSNANGSPNRLLAIFMRKGIDMK